MLGAAFDQPIPAAQNGHAYNEQIKQEVLQSKQYQPILEVIKNQDTSITTLQIINQETDTTEQIITTPGHPFYLKEAPEANRAKANAQHLAIAGHPGLSNRWIAAGDLITGDQIASADGISKTGRGGTIASTQAITEDRLMYNLDVASPGSRSEPSRRGGTRAAPETGATDSFYVGDGGWLVHNCPSVDLGSKVASSFTQPGWIKKDLYSDLSQMVKEGKLPEDALLKFEKSLKSMTSGQGGTGIKQMSDGSYELKILGKNGGMRLYGSIAENGQVIFTKFAPGHK